MNLSTSQKLVAGLVVLASGYLIYRYISPASGASGAGAGALPAGGGGSPSLPSGEAKTVDQIKILQRALNQLPTGPKLVVDGIYGAQTAAAVKAFQASVGLAQSGVADLATIAAIRAKLKAMGVYDTTVNA